MGERFSGLSFEVGFGAALPPGNPIRVKSRLSTLLIIRAAAAAWYKPNPADEEVPA
jgi:hypothetical protein